MAPTEEGAGTRYGAIPERVYIGRYPTRDLAERVSATYGDARYPNRTVEPEEVGGRTDWLIWCDRTGGEL